LTGGNVSAAVKMTLLGLTLGSPATPICVQALPDTRIEIDIASVVGQIGVIVFLPPIARCPTRALLVNRFGTQSVHQHIALRFPGLSTLGVRGAVIVAMAYIIQVQSAAWHVRVADRIYGGIDNQRHRRWDRDTTPSG
jgi:hypothetical protein